MIPQFEKKVLSPSCRSAFGQGGPIFPCSPCTVSPFHLCSHELNLLATPSPPLPPSAFKMAAVVLGRWLVACSLGSGPFACPSNSPPLPPTYSSTQALPFGLRSSLDPLPHLLTSQTTFTSPARSTLRSEPSPSPSLRPIQLFNLLGRTAGPPRSTHND
jgi:hypothetical protein